jgi:hypothetical protein
MLPATATKDVNDGTAILDGGAIDGSASVAAPIAILHPLRDVPVHIVEPKRIGLERAYWSRVDVSVATAHDSSTPYHEISLLWGLASNIAVNA